MCTHLGVVEPKNPQRRFRDNANVAFDGKPCGLRPPLRQRSHQQNKRCLLLQVQGSGPPRLAFRGSEGKDPNLGPRNKPLFHGLNGGRTRDRTLDLSRVKGTLSLVSPSARPKNRRRTAAYAAYDFVVSYAICPVINGEWDRIGPAFSPTQRGASFGHKPGCASLIVDVRRCRAVSNTTCLYFFVLSICPPVRSNSIALRTFCELDLIAWKEMYVTDGSESASKIAD